MTAATVLPAAGVRVVGAVLWLSAVAKAVAPRGFAAHLERLAPLSERLAVVTAVAVVVGEAALAMPLIVAAGPPAAEVAAMVLMAALSIATLWAWRLGRIEECGCYGPFLRLSPPVSSAINLAMILLLAAGLAFRNPAATVRRGVLAWATCAGVSLVVAVLVLPRLSGLIAAGRPWPSRWLPEVKIAQGDGERIVAFLQPGCLRCQVWAKALETVRQTGVPGHFGGVGRPREARRGVGGRRAVSTCGLWGGPIVAARGRGPDGRSGAGRPDCRSVAKCDAPRMGGALEAVTTGTPASRRPDRPTRHCGTASRSNPPSCLRRSAPIHRSAVWNRRAPARRSARRYVSRRE